MKTTNPQLCTSVLLAQGREGNGAKRYMCNLLEYLIKSWKCDHSVISEWRFLAHLSLHRVGGNGSLTHLRKHRCALSLWLLVKANRHWWTWGFTQKYLLLTNTMQVKVSIIRFKTSYRVQLRNLDEHKLNFWIIFLCWVTLLWPWFGRYGPHTCDILPPFDGVYATVLLIL